MVFNFEQLNLSETHLIAFAEVDYTKESELLLHLKKTAFNLDELRNISNIKRRIEWLSIRYIISQIHNSNEDIIYDKHRKPHFATCNHHISISHSHHMVAISINKNEVTGIDIQLVSDKIKRIKSKFLNTIEQNKISDDSLTLTYSWSIKEALFKIYGKKDAYLKENISINEIQFDEGFGKAKGTIDCGKYHSEHLLELKKVGEYVIAYAVNS